MIQGEKKSSWDSLQVEIRPQIVQSLLANNFVSTMPVQEAAIPLLLKNYDLAVEAQTGSGKTLAFVVPLLQKYLQMKLPMNKSSIKFVIISPTRELCQQTFEVIEKLLSSIPNKNQGQLYRKFVKCATGGNQLKQDQKNIKQDTVVLVGTVGRLKELGNHFEQNWLKKVDYLYIDEADRVLKQKGINQLLRMIQKIRRTAMFSATLSGLLPKDYQFYGMRNLAKISVKPMQKKPQNSSITPQQKPKYTIPKSLYNTYLKMPNRKQKITFLFAFLSKYLSKYKIIIFFNTCASVDFYTKLLCEFFRKELPELENCIYGIHGKLKNKRRAKILNAYTMAKAGCLIATDVVARGIDFDHVHYILQIDPPEDPDNYIHRIGRTARINRPGTAILFIENHEEAFINYLGNKGIGVQLVQNYDHFIEGYQSQKIQEQMDSIVQQIMVSDRDYIEKSKKAFVSYIRSYKEHDLRYIFQFKNLSIGFTAQSFFLLRIPRIKEILGKKIDNFLQSQIDPETIPWLDHNQEQQYSAKKQKLQIQKQKRQKMNQRLSNKKDIKNDKSKRKRLKDKRQSKEMKKMKIQYKQLKKQKRQIMYGEKMSEQEWSESGEESDTEQIEKKMQNKYGK